jgi:EcsC protein family
MANPLSIAAGQVGKVALTAIDHVAIRRFADSEQLYERALSANSRATPDTLATSIIRRVAKELGAAGAVSGVIAAAPGIGTSASIATGAADIGVSFGRLASMVLAIGLAYGIELTAADERRRHVYAVLSGSSEQLTQGERKAGELKKKLGQQALGRGDGATGDLGNLVTSKVGAKMLSKLATKEAAVKLGTLLPLGIGAGVGAVGNRALVFSVGRTAVKYFGSVRQQTTGQQPPIQGRVIAAGHRPTNDGTGPTYVKSSALKRAADRVRRK